MKEQYITITGIKHYYGIIPFEIGRKITCVKEPDNYYDQEEQINEYELTLFVKCRQEEDLYRKYQEVHFQRAYTLEEIKTLIEKSGLTFLNAYDDYTRETATEESERIVVVCRECGKVTEKKV